MKRKFFVENGMEVIGKMEKVQKVDEEVLSLSMDNFDKKLLFLKIED